MKWVDLLIVATLLINTMLGYKKGLILTLFSLGSYIVAVLVAKTYYVQLAAWIKNSPSFGGRIQQFVEGQLSFYLPKGVGTVSEFSEKKIVEEIGFPDFIQNYLLKEFSIETYTNQTMEIAKLHFQSLVVNLFINIISMIILFILVRTLILVIGYLINGVFEIPILETMNRLGGGILGIIRGGVWVGVVVLAMTVMAMINLEGVIALGIKESVLFPIITNFFTGFILKWM
ncbi:hypothetical protein CACET_c39310 [Clostridium aceticum]|uniref:Uncharacterized protein n=1 Tax=Clostridium aceticum TaxID=84022 RepID=A0A0D8I7X0_9CLOT|nr:CvpA family protein [Clostridium aceticum]AKL97357.1 hypothetical protein CACET_c39310 [Clostridium aceticum]KJF26365.1 hypothetical protein TZ02_14495 [Clostridium aceticum]